MTENDFEQVLGQVICKYIRHVIREALSQQRSIVEEMLGGQHQVPQDQPQDTPHMPEVSAQPQNGVSPPAAVPRPSFSPLQQDPSVAALHVAKADKDAKEAEAANQENKAPVDDGGVTFITDLGGEP